MPINVKFQRILHEYTEARHQPFRGNSLAKFIRHDLTNEVRSLFDASQRYFTEGSAGKGNWAEIPWVGIFDKTVTTSAQEGYYIVFLFRADMTGFYLSLNQGITAIKETYRTDALRALHARSNDFCAQLGIDDKTLITGPIDLKSAKKGSNGFYYQEGSIVAKFYDAHQHYSDDEFKADINYFLDLYLALVDKELSTSRSSIEYDEHDIGIENLHRFREHKRIERNQSLSKKVKIVRGYVCEACGFDFFSFYGDIGKEFIEAHHLQPLSTLRKQGKAYARLDPKKDFAVLCSSL